MKHLIWLLSLSLLAACSSGGGDAEDDTSEQETATVERISLTGLAVKGLAKAAKVEAFITQGSSFKNSPDATTLTNSNGEYTIRFDEELDGYEGPVKIVLSYNDTNSQLQCDDPDGCGGAINYGDFYAMPEDFELKSVVNVGSGVETLAGDTIANISALTTLATNYLESQESITETTIKQSNNQVRALFSLPSEVDLVGTQPQVVSPDSNEKGDATYGAINAAFQKIASDSSLRVDEVITAFSNELIARNGQLYEKAPTEGDDVDAPSIFDVTNAAVDINTDLGLLDAAELDAVDTYNNALAVGVVSDINPPTVTAGDDIEVNSGETANLLAKVVIGDTTGAFLWQVISGNLDLSSVTTNEAALSFTAPAEGGVITLRVIYENSDGADNDLVNVTVKPTLATDTSDSGEYLITASQISLGGGGSSLDVEGELWTEDLVVTFNSNGTGSLSGVANRATHSWEATQSLSQADAIDVYGRTYESGNEPETFSLPATQLANGTFKISIAPEVDEGDDGQGTVTERSYKDAYDVDFIKLTDGLYAASHLYFTEDYNVNDGVDEADPFRRDVNVEQLTLNKNTSFTGFASLANKEYVGVVVRVEVDETLGYSYVVQKEVLGYDATGANFSSYQVGARSNVMPNSDISVGFSTDTNVFEPIDNTLTPENTATNQFSVTANGFNIGLGTQDTGGLVSANISEDLSAFTVSNLEYANTSGSIFTDGSPVSNSFVKGIFFEANPGVQLDGKTFSFTGINYLVEHIDSITTRAPETALETYKGTIAFDGTTVTISYQMVNGRASHNTQTVQNPVDVSIDLNRIAESGSVQLTFDSSIADELGCVQETAPGTLELCVSENGVIIGHDEQENTNGDNEDISLHRFFGKEVSDNNAQVAHFLPTIEGKTYLATFDDGAGGEGTGLYNFTDASNGNVEWHDDLGNPESFTWSIDANGALVVVLSGGGTDTYTLISGNQNKGGIEFKIDGNVQYGGAAQSWERQYP